MTAAEIIAQEFAKHTAKSARAIGLHVHPGRRHTSRMELRNALTGERIALREHLPNTEILTAASAALKAITQERKRLEDDAQLAGTQRRSPQADCKRTHAALAAIA